VGAERLTSQSITADEILAAGMSARLEFSCPRPLHGVEVRLFADGLFSAGITAVEINGEIADSTAEFQSLRISDLPDPGVEQSIRKGRNLYEGYQRGIGLQFSNLGARIAVDPIFAVPARWQGDARSSEMRAWRTSFCF
jgi:hypothetical protein